MKFEVEQKSVEQATTPAEAKRLGSTTYFSGVPCKRGHVANRYAANATCCACRASGLHRGKLETRRAWQREANRRDRLAQRGGCTPEMKTAMIAGQNGCCAICSAQTELFIDHCHATNRIRAALCRPCNLALGMAKDNPDTLRAMAGYLDRHMHPLPDSMKEQA